MNATSSLNPSAHNSRAHAAFACVAVASMALVGGCLERRVSITTEPAGAVVYLNDVEVGRTPVEADFTFYGSYDVRIDKEGYEPVRTKAKAQAPIYEYPPIDVLAVASPFDFETTIKWHFELTPVLKDTQSTEQVELGLLERADVLRKQLSPPVPAPE